MDKKGMTRESEAATASFVTLVDLVQFRAQQQPYQTVYTFLKDGDIEESSLSYQELDRRARTVGAHLQALGLAGQRVLLLYPAGLDFIVAFFACLYAGVVAIPAYPPRNHRNLPRIQAIIADAESTVVLTTTTSLAKTQSIFQRANTPDGLRWIATDTLTDEIAGDWQRPQLNSDTLAFLQYTSGSTGSPKGVMVSHGNILSNEEMIRVAFQHTPSDVVVGWLPMFHDMGLIGNVLQPVYLGAQVILMSPAAFLQRPIRWLRAISTYRATTSGGPNFAYDLCTRKISPEERTTLDLSSWRVAFNGAEPIRASTLDEFSDAFASCGFRREAFFPCYGLAEASLLVSGGPADLPPAVFSVDRSALDQHRIVPVSVKARDTHKLVGSGGNVPGQRIAIVNPETLAQCAPEEIGEIWIAGDHIAKGYWGQPNETTATFQACLADIGEVPFLRTGDLGFLREGNLVVTGRAKDLIILRGRNVYPQDVELTAEQSHPALRPGCGAAFSVQIDNQEQLVVVQELEPRTKGDLQEVLRSIRQVVAEEHEIQVYHVVLIKAGAIPKTSSGKIQHLATRAKYLAGELQVVSDWRADYESGEQASIDATTDQHSGVGSILELQKAPPASAIEDWLVTRLAGKVGLAPSEIDIHQPFTYYGLGSIEGVELAGKLEGWLSRSVPPTLVWDYPNIKAIAQYLSSETFSDTNAAIRELTTNCEPIAIIGLGCRLPGAPDVPAFWELLHGGIDAITEVPPDRWDSNVFYDPTPATPGKMDTRWGGFLEQIDKFDSDFFSIAPREAERMDPQQRLLLEVAWEALEDAGLAPDQLAGSQTGVFVGISSSDYYMSQFRDPVSNDAYTGTGNAFSVAANRISYLLDLQGPSMAVDTACSSSLVAVDLACDSLRNGNCDLALASGVNVILSPQLTISFSQARMMSPDGRCKTFDTEADGYVRGEGCGTVVLKRLPDAMADGDRILAVIRGSAVNQDGRSNGLTAPNGLAQQAVIRRALAASGVKPSQISYVEAHGTGTPLGDPIELHALAAIYGQARLKEQPLVVGSVKTNVGHLEAAAGIAGLIKVVLALQHEAIPSHLHLKQLNPHIPLYEMPVVFPTEQLPWFAGEEHRFAAVSSFGFGGTNAHVILEEAPVPASVTEEIARPLHLLTLSAKSEAALKQLSARYAQHLAAHPEIRLGDMCYTANTGRAHFAHRLAVTASPEDMGEQLAVFAAGESPAGFCSGQVLGSQRPKLAFLFTGQGSQYWGMGRELYATQPTFRQALDRCDEVLRPYLETPLISVLYADTEEVSRLDETAYTQPALFALEYALATLWQSWGVTPDVVMGHSVGEYVAACIAGVFTLEDGLKLIAERGRLMQALPREGEVVAVLADEVRVSTAIQPYAGEVSLAGINGPESMVISGKREAVQAVSAVLEGEGVKTKTLQVSHAFHSPLMEPMLAAFERVAQQVKFSPPQIDLVSNVTGQRVTEEIATPAYWCRHVRQPVRFADSMQTLHQQGCEVFIELGPQPTLLGMGRQCLPGDVGVWLPSLRQGQADWQPLLQSAGELYVCGVAVDWSGFDRDYARRRVGLPTYPFQRQRYWMEAAESQRQATTTASSQEHAQSDILRLLNQGEAQQLTQIVQQAGEFSEETRQRLPEIVNILIGQHQRQVTAAALKDWLYELQWQPKPRRHKSGAQTTLLPAPGSWLIFADRGGVGQAVAALLEERGQHCILVFAGEVYEAEENGSWRLNPASPAEVERLFDDVLATSTPPFNGVIHLWSLDTAPADALTISELAQAQMLGCGSTLHLVQALVKHQGAAAPRLWLVTRGAVAVEDQAAPLAIAQAPVWGLGRVVALEHPEVWGGLLDLAPAAVQEEAALVLAELWDSQGEDQIVLREGQRYVARLVRSTLPEPQGVKLRADGSYLITGGLGALGLRVAQWMVDQGARHLVLTGRRGASNQAQDIVSQLEQAGAQVLVVQADVANEQDMVRVLEQINAAAPPLQGIVHAAGVLDDGILLRQDWGRFTTVMAPKVMGAWNLHTLTLNIPLDFFVCFSSTASLLGSPGQGNYAAANAFLDALTHHRQALGLRGLSINWGPWAESGMAASLDNRDQARLSTQGLNTIAPVQGVRVLEHLLGSAIAEVGVLSIDWPVFRQQFFANRHLPLFSEVVGDVGEQEQGERELTHRQEFLHRLKEALPGDRQHLLTTYLQAEVAKVLGLASSQLPEPQQGFMDMGIDSLMAMELRNRLETALGHSLPVTVVFNYPNIELLAQHLFKDVISLETAAQSQSNFFEIQEETIPSLGKIDSRSAREDPKWSVNRKNAKHLLTNLDQLSDEEVDVLLAAYSAENDGGSSRKKANKREEKDALTYTDTTG